MADPARAEEAASLYRDTAMSRFWPCFFTACGAAVCLAAAPGASAGTVGVHLGSVHFPARHFNNVNPGLYWRSDAGWTLGAYRNSLDRTSAYAGYSWQWRALALTAGGVTGYADDVQPLLVPSVALFSAQGVTARVAFIPRVEKRIESHVLHVMVEY
ncbi:hypothetical protein [Piscinibacter sp. XHJ-5]|uniref:hypothetical protein n=1 Tax=Piscinibacter sp. XHJ-5 TaxID=3037797 RepID=UPI00245354C3|nr:hypothetical protein [Piscinibacter sp. XHJ-5]